MFASGCSFSLKYCLIRSPYPLPRIVDSLTSRLSSFLLRLFPLAFWHLIILEWWAKREKVLSKTQNYYIDTNAVKLIATFCSALLVWASSNKWTGKVVARSNWRQKRRGKDVCVLSCLIYRFGPFSTYYIRKSCHMPFFRLVPSVTLTAA